VGSVGLAILTSQNEYYDQHAMAIMLADFNEADFQMLPNLTQDTTALAGELTSWCQIVAYIFAGLVNKSSDLSDYAVRQIIGIGEDEKLVAIGDYLQHNDEIIFCRRDGDSAMQDMERMLLELKLRVGPTIRGGVYVSCLGRGREQFGDHSEEVRFIHSVLGDFPLVGFFANGEIHKNTLYGYTGVLTLFV